MSGSQGAFLNALDPLSGMTNPFEFSNQVSQARKNALDVENQQGQKVWGQALLKNTDANGNVDYQGAARDAAAAGGPAAAMAARSALGDMATQRTQQINQQHMKIGYINGALGALPDSASRDDVVRSIQNGSMAGFTPTEIQNEIAQVPTDQAGVAAYIQQHRLTGAQVATQLQQSGGRLGMSAEDQNTIIQVSYPKLNADGTANQNYGKTFPMRKGDVVPMLATPGQVQGQGDGGGLPSSLRNPAKAPPTGVAPAAPPAATTGPTTAPPATGGNTGIGAVLGGSALPLPPTPPAVVPPPVPLPTAPGAVWNPNNPVGTSTVAPPAANPAAGAVAAAKASGKPVPVPGGNGLVANPDGTVGPPRLPPGPRADLQGGVPVASATNALQPNVGAPAPPSPLVAGDVNAIMAGMQRGATPTAGTAAAGPAAPSPTYFGTGPSAADLEQQKRGAEQGMTGFQAISDQAVASRSRSAILGNMLGDTTQFSTGPLTSKIATLRNIANRFGLPVNIEGLSAQESFNKLAAQLATAQNPNSDAKLSVSQAANPHQELSPAGVDLMMRQLQGNEDYYQARAKLASSYGDQTDIKKFESDVGSKVDPRAFQFARMTPAQRQTYDKGLSATDRAAVRSSYNWLSSQPGLMGQ